MHNERADQKGQEPTEPTPIAYGIAHKSITPEVVREIITIFGRICYEQDLFTDNPLYTRGIDPERAAREIKEKLLRDPGNPADFMHPLAFVEEAVLFFFPGTSYFDKTRKQMANLPVRVEYHPGGFVFSKPREEVDQKTAQFTSEVTNYLLSTGLAVPFTR